jgi:MFS transporter, PPP family, 3-phenylpropionic acid transporter
VLRLCTYWFVMTAALGVYFPYFSLYLKEALGFSGAQVGAAFAVPPLVGLFAQPLWGYVADRTGSRARVLTLLSFGTAAGYGLLTIPRDYVPTMFAITLLSMFSSAQIPMAVAVSLSAIARHPTRVSFGHVRVWGTLGFFLTVLGVPPLVRSVAAARGTSEPEQFHFALGLAAVLAACASLIALTLPSVPAAERLRMARGEERLLLRDRAYLRVLLVIALAYGFLHGPMVLFPVYVHARGGDHATISYMWSFSLSMETLLMFSSAALYRRFGPKPTISFGIIACGVRWLICGVCYDLRYVYPLQMLHGAMVMSLQVGAPLLVEELVPERLRASSQAGLNMVGASLGGVASSMLAGVLLDSAGIDVVMLLGGAAGLLLGLATPWILPAPRAVVAAPEPLPP